MNLNGPAWRHYNPILSNYGGPVYRAPRGARLVRPGCAIKSDVNGRNPRPAVSRRSFRTYSRCSTGGLASFQPGSQERR